MSRGGKGKRRGPRFPDANRPHFVYSHRNAKGEIIYLGCTVDVDARSRTHRYTAKWWPEVAEVVVEGIRPDRRSGTHLEACLIIRHEPRYNIQHNRTAIMARNDWRGERARAYAEDDGNAEFLAMHEKWAETDADWAEYVLPVIRARYAAAHLAGAA